jgi:hypothetical protein
VEKVLNSMVAQLPEIEIDIDAENNASGKWHQASSLPPLPSQEMQPSIISKPTTPSGKVWNFINLSY